MSSAAEEEDFLAWLGSTSQPVGETSPLDPPLDSPLIDPHAVFAAWLEDQL